MDWGSAESMGVARIEASFEEPSRACVPVACTLVPRLNSPDTTLPMGVGGKLTFLAGATAIERWHHTHIRGRVARVLLGSHTFAPYSHAEISSEVV